MSPVVIGNATLYLGDCLDILPGLPKCDAVITDPPYGLGDKWTGGTWFTKNAYENDDVIWDRATPAATTIAAILAISKTQIIWGGNYFELPPSRCWLSWAKRDNMPTMADFELAWTSLDKPAKEFYHARSGFERKHPTQKPLPLMRWCIEQAGNPQTILDPYMGSGTTGVACMQMGRAFIGIEKEPKYFDIACKRIEAAQKQPDMFIEPKPAPRIEQGTLFAAA